MKSIQAAAAKHIRNRIKVAGIKARVLWSERQNGQWVVTVVSPAFNAYFTTSEIETFCSIADANGFAFIRGVKIVPAQEKLLTGKQQWDFYATPAVKEWAA